MKKIITITLAILIAYPALCQEEKLRELQNLENNSIKKVVPDTASKAANQVVMQTDSVPVSSNKAVSGKNDTVVVELGDEIFSIKGLGEETRIKIGKKEFRVVENDDGVVVFKSKNNEPYEKHHPRFRGHLGGLEFGFNGLLTDFFSTSLSPEDSYFDLNTAKSINWNLLLPCVSIPFTSHFGIASTLGISWNKYRFDGNNSIVKGEDGVIGPYYPEPGITYSKSRLLTTYATLPVILEVQIPVAHNHNTINIGGGVIGAVKLGSHTRVVYYTDGKQKEKHKDDFSLNTFRWGATARVGYEFFQIYGTCYFTSLFEKGKGPELYPFEVGMAFTFND